MDVAFGLAHRQVTVLLKNPSLFIPPMLFPLMNFMAFAGGLSRLRHVPGFDFHGGYTAFQFVFVLLQSAAFGGVFAGFGIARDFERGFARRLLVSAPQRSGIIAGYAIAAFVRWAMIAVLLTGVALAAGMQVGGGGVDLFGLFALGIIFNQIGLLWACGVAMRFRSVQAGPLMQTPVFMALFLAPVYVPLDLLRGWIHTLRAEPADVHPRGGSWLHRGRADPGRTGVRPRRRSLRRLRRLGAHRAPRRRGAPASFASEANERGGRRAVARSRGCVARASRRQAPVALGRARVRGSIEQGWCVVDVKRACTRSRYASGVQRARVGLKVAVRGRGALGCGARAAESVAAARLAALVAAREPLLALGRRAVRPRLRVDPPLRLLLDAVVADGGRSIEAVVDVLLREVDDVAGRDGVARPDTRVAVRLQLGAHRAPVAPCDCCPRRSPSRSCAWWPYSCAITYASANGPPCAPKRSCSSW